MPFLLLGLLIAALAMGGNKGATAGTAGALEPRPRPRPRRDPYREMLRRDLEEQGWIVEDIED